MKHIYIQKALTADMKTVAGIFCEAKGDRIKCPFHGGNEKEMKIYSDHVFCPECGIFNQIDFVARIADMDRENAVSLINAAAAPDSIVSTARKIMRAIYKQKCKESPKFKNNLPGEFTGLYIRDVFAHFPAFQNTDLAAGNLHDGTVYFLDEGFADADGNIIGKPIFTKIRGDSDYITVCSSIRKAVMMTGDSAWNVRPEDLLPYGKAVLCRTEKESYEFAEAGFKAGYKPAGAKKISWTEKKHISEADFQYHDRGDLFDYLRSIPGIDQWQTDLTDSWLFSSGEDYTLPLEALMTPSGKKALRAIRYPDPLHIVNTCKAIRKNGKHKERTEEIALKKNAAVKKIKPDHSKSKRNPVILKPVQNGGHYRRIPKNRIWFSDGTARIKAENGYIETSAKNVFRIPKGKSDFLYVPVRAELTRKFRTEGGTVAGPLKENDLKKFKEIEYKDKFVTIGPVFLKTIGQAEDGRLKIPVDRNRFIYVSRKNLRTDRNADRKKDKIGIFQDRRSHSYLVRDAEGAPVKKDGKIRRISFGSLEGVNISHIQNIQRTMHNEIEK